MADRRTKERKLVALMVNDLEAANLSESEMRQMKEEVHSIPDEELDRTLALRLDLPYPVDEEVMARVLARVAEPEHLAQEELEGFTGAPDMSHEPRPEEREG
jgi:MoxR-like ATPase